MVIIEKIQVKNFRNIKESLFYPSKKINFLVGDNGQGKTSYIEALGYLSHLRSFRDSKNFQVIQQNAQKSEISCTIASESDLSWKTQLNLELQKSSEEENQEFSSKKNTQVTKRAFINGKQYASSTQYLSQRLSQYHLGFHAITFNPSDHDLVRGDPAIRRSYLDRVLASQDIDYLQTLQKYQKTLRHRNALLKDEKLYSETWLSFTEPLCKYGSWITHKRLEWVKNTQPEFLAILKSITPSQKTTEILYASDWVSEKKHFTGQEELPSLELLEQNFWKKASTLQSTERKVGHSLVGPHRDDWLFLIGQDVLKGHGSQGEVRSALVALKLSEINLFRKKTGHRPVFLLDDFSSELDRERRSFLLNYLMEKDLQTFITTTENLGFQGKLFTVSQGKIREEGLYDDRTQIA